MRSACAGEPFYQKHEGKRYCVLHFPGKEKSAVFKKGLQRKLDRKDFDFQGVWFPDEVRFYPFESGTEVNFSHATFAARVAFGGFGAAAKFSYASFWGNADFDRATFSGKADFAFATFSAEANFSSATFSQEANFLGIKVSAEANFSSATFSAEASFSGTFVADAKFDFAAFKAVVYFSQANFRAVSFYLATFSSDVLFIGATFSGQTTFRYATFAGHLRFARARGLPVFSSTSSLDLELVEIEKTEKVSFHTVILRPHWFVNVDPRKFDFTNVDWDWRNANQEIKSLETRGVSSPQSFLAIACRRLAENAEDDNRYEDASKFRYLAMDAKRLERLHGFAFWRLSWWYWLASGYGERAFQALVVLLGVWILFGLIYTRVGFAHWEPKLASEPDTIVAKRDDTAAPLNFSRALTYSAGVMTLQKPEPKPATTAAQTVVLLETILGPVQAALLALAIRRKFMR